MIYHFPGDCTDVVVRSDRPPGLLRLDFFVVELFNKTYTRTWRFELLDIVKQMRSWSEDEGKTPLYAAVVVGIEGSAVRGAGAVMGIAADGSLTGSVSGGCIESTAVAAAARLRENSLEDRLQAELLVFCPHDDPFMGAPAPCGGTVRVCVFPFSLKVAEALEKRVNSGRIGRWGLVIEGSPEWTGCSCALDANGNMVTSLPISAHEPRDLWREFLAEQEQEGVHELGPMKVFAHSEPVLPHAVIVGGSHIGEALMKILKQIHWRVSVVDPRESFASSDRFGDADTLLHEWPQEAFGSLVGDPERTAIAAITHSEQIDDTAVEQGLRRGCYYVGVLGSSRTFTARMKRLGERGYTENQLAHVHGPVGLDIGAETPEEIALSIAAEMVRDYRKSPRERGEGR